MRIFKAQLEDITRIMECAREFCAVLGHELNELHYANFWLFKISDHDGVIFLLEHEGEVVGGIGGIKSSQPLSGKLVAVELFWYVKEKYRNGLWPMRLLSEFERWSEECGCESISMIHMEKSMPDHLKKVYQRMGYELIETVHSKSILKGVAA
jgi:GNAT superfamily N-acetyltransferase